MVKEDRSLEGSHGSIEGGQLAVGAVLAQADDRPISFFSKKFTDAEKKYSTFDRELLAVFLSIKHFRHVLEGTFTVLPLP